MSPRVRVATLGIAAAFAMALGTVSWGTPAAGDDKQPPKIEGDLKRMQGQWISKDGQGQESVWVFKGEHVSLKTPTRAYEMTIIVNSKGEPEKHIDFDVAEDSPNAKGYKAQGIYRFTGDDTLKICFGDGETGRPKEFKTDFGKSFFFELSRKK
jgi:uncharacterized protein (TIGR03067 family)